MNTIAIYAPRFSTGDVLIAPYKVQPGLNRIIFTKTWHGVELYMDGDMIKSYPLTTNGKIYVHAVPVHDFQQPDTQPKLL